MICENVNDLDRILILEVCSFLRVQINRLEILMATQPTSLSNQLGSIQGNLSQVTTTLGNVQAGVLKLDQRITDFQNSPGTLSPSDQAALDAIQQASKDLVTLSGAIDVTPPSTTPPGTPGTGPADPTNPSAPAAAFQTRPAVK